MKVAEYTAHITQHDSTHTEKEMLSLMTTINK